MDQNKILLFDIDGTLVHSKCDKESFRIVGEKVFGVKVNIENVVPFGKSDQQIILETMLAYDVAEEMILDRMEQALSVMETYYIQSDDVVTILPGVKELLKQVVQQGYILGLVTGNTKAIAYNKLERVALENFFNFGGFGNDSAVRANLVTIALKRGQQQVGVAIDKANVVVIGDTPRDIIAGNTAGVKSLGVATGKYTAEEIKEGGDCVVVEDFSQTEAILDIIESLI